MRRPDGGASVREWYDYTGGARVPSKDGKGTVPAVRASGLVDECVRVTHQKEYSGWRGYVTANEERLYAEAIAKLEEKEGK